MVEILYAFGLQRRWMTSGEYIQMSGRAGRRGKDDFGVVIQMIDDTMDTRACRCSSGFRFQGLQPVNSMAPWP